MITFLLVNDTFCLFMILTANINIVQQGIENKSPNAIANNVYNPSPAASM